MSGSLGYAPAIQGGVGRPQMAGLDPNSLQASPTQQMSVADQLAAVGIPMGSKDASGGLTPSAVTPPPLGSESTTTTKSGGGSLGGILGLVGGIAGSIVAPGAGTMVGSQLGGMIGNQIHT